MQTNRPSDFINLEDYLELNKEQTQEMSDRITGALDQERAGAEAELRKSKHDFEEKKKAGTNRGPTGHDKAFMSSADAQQRATSSYQGPDSLSDANPDLSATFADAQARLALAGTGGGREQLLAQEYAPKGQQYSKGGRTMDAALMGAQSGGALEAAARGAGDLEKMLGLEQEKAQAESAAARGESAEASKAWEVALPGIQQREADAAAAERAREIEAERQASAARDQTEWERQESEQMEDRAGTDGTRSVGDEEYAAMHGMTYSEWVEAGRPSTDAEWKAYRQKKLADTQEKEG
jgi:hypothetical protein